MTKPDQATELSWIVGRWLGEVDYARETAHLWPSSTVASYVQNSIQGIPYVECPPHLRPENGNETSWVVLAPTLDEGVVIEWALLDDIRRRQRIVKLLGPFAVYPLMAIIFWTVLALGFRIGWPGVGWVVAALVGVGFLFAGGRIVSRIMFKPIQLKLQDGYRWIVFPPDLRLSLEAAMAKVDRRQALIVAIGKGLSTLAGPFAEAAVGKFSGKLLEQAVGVGIDTAGKEYVERYAVNAARAHVDASGDEKNR